MPGHGPTGAAPQARIVCTPQDRLVRFIARYQESSAPRLRVGQPRGFLRGPGRVARRMLDALWSSAMTDFLLVLLTSVFFALSIGYLRAIGRL